VGTSLSSWPHQETLASLSTGTISYQIDKF
jgi:hypothetical protein